MSYSIGTYKINNEMKTIECQSSKSIWFSLNIGKVVFYTKDCKGSFNLSYSEDSGLQRELPHRVIGFDSTGVPIIKSSGVKYRTTEFKGNFGYFLDNFEDETKLKDCN